MVTGLCHYGVCSECNVFELSWLVCATAATVAMIMHLNWDHNSADCNLHRTLNIYLLCFFGLYC